MPPKRWNALKAAMWGVIIGAAYSAGLIVFEGRIYEPPARLAGELLGGGMGFALVVGLFAQARNWVTGAR